MAHRKKKRDALGMISNKSHQIKIKNTTPLVNDLEIQDVFEVENKREGGSVMDFIKEVS